MWYCYLGTLKLYIWKSPNQPIPFTAKDDLQQTYFHSTWRAPKASISFAEIESIGISQQTCQAHVPNFSDP